MVGILQADIFTNKTVLITGAASGIGRGLALHAAKLQMNVVLMDLNKNGLSETHSLMADCPSMIIQCDVSNLEDFAKAKEQIESEFGTVHFLFNNAGIFLEGRAWKADQKNWQRIIDVNLMSVIYGLNLFVDEMVASQERCHIINTSSMAGIIVGPALAPYTTTKHAVVGLTRTLHEDLADNDKVGVSVLCPGLVQTNIIENAWKNNVKKLLFLGSSCVYPKFSSQPIKEEELLKSELEKTNEWYALAKISGIKICQALRKQYGFDAISLMPTNLYGAGDNYHEKNSHVLPALINRFHSHKLANKNLLYCWGSGKPRREFLHVNDLAEASIFALEKWDPNNKDSPRDEFGEPLTWLNVGTGIDIEIKNLAEMIADITCYKGKILWDIEKPDGTYQKLLDVSRIKSLGWSANIPLHEGLKKTYASFKKDSAENNLRIK